MTSTYRIEERRTNNAPTRYCIMKFDGKREVLIHCYATAHAAMAVMKSMRQEVAHRAYATGNGAAIVRE
jgi:hypothetical protein